MDEVKGIIGCQGTIGGPIAKQRSLTGNFTHYKQITNTGQWQLMVRKAAKRYIILCEYTTNFIKIYL